MNNQVILITGASDGIGRALALLAAEAGAKLILVGKSTNKLDQLYDEIRLLKKNSNSTIHLPLLLPVNLLQLSPQNAQEIHDAILQQFGKLDGLVHLAGDLFGLQPIALYDLQQWQQTLHLHLHVPFLLTKTLLPLLKQSEAARILFATDSVGSEGKAYYGAYACAKSGVETLAKILAQELEQNTNMLVQAIYPGKVSTRLQRRITPDSDLSEFQTPLEAARLFLAGLGVVVDC